MILFLDIIAFSDIRYNICHQSALHPSGPAPIILNSDEDEDGGWQMDADDMRDYIEQDILAPRAAQAAGPYARFLANMPDWINMTQEEYIKCWEAFPLPAVGPVPPGISLRIKTEIWASRSDQFHCFINHYKPL
jgi:hypothetical protein